MYDIKRYSLKKAKELGVKIKPSNYKNKKIDVYDWNMNYILSIGDIRYSDYPTYLITKGKEFADNRRRLYKLRHAKDLENMGSKGYYASYLLW